MQAAYLVLVETQGAKGIPATEMLWYNSVTSLPMLMAAAWATGEWGVMHHMFVVGASKFGFGSMITCIILCSTGKTDTLKYLKMVLILSFARSHL
jgi:hypothetical protein